MPGHCGSGNRIRAAAMPLMGIRVRSREDLVVSSTLRAAARTSRSRHHQRGVQVPHRHNTPEQGEERIIIREVNT